MILPTTEVYTHNPLPKKQLLAYRNYARRPMMTSKAASPLKLKKAV